MNAQGYIDREFGRKHDTLRARFRDPGSESAFMVRGSKAPLIGLMLGDATGIGPEIAAKVLASRAVADVARIVVIGDARVLELGMRDAGANVPYCACQRIADIACRPTPCLSSTSRTSTRRTSPEVRFPANQDGSPARRSST